MYELTTSINNEVLDWSEYCMNKENAYEVSAPAVHRGVLGRNAERISQWEMV